MHEEDASPVNEALALFRAPPSKMKALSAPLEYAPGSPCAQ